ncbi:MAG: adaptive-response sensory kinase [Syntrophorhabdus sp. PtaU1.Bin153]|nr:MAG: adaptive-response sensory kinase [Syntrophorhabdus sp. PtaU1.Bin153]
MRSSQVEEKLSGNLSRSLTNFPQNQSLGLLKILSHDLRGSLVSMSALLDALSRGYHVQNDGMIEMKLVELIDKMDSLSGMLEESLQMMLATEEDDGRENPLLDLEHDVIQPVISDFASEIRDRHIRIENGEEATENFLFPVKTNMTVLKMIVRNLLSNAMKHTETGGTIAVNTKYGGPFCLLRIHNGKSPVSGELRLDRRAKNPREIGLELHLAKRIMQTQGGEIWYEPEEEGIRFVLAIPVDTGRRRYTSYSQGRLFS